MAPRLILLGGVPGVGKSTTARLLFQRLQNSLWVDGDDLWRMNPFQVTDVTKRMVEANIAAVLRNGLTSGFDHVIFSWVLHRQAIIDRVLSMVADLEAQRYVFTLHCSPEVLADRWSGEPHRGALYPDVVSSLHETTRLATTQIDTTYLSPEAVVARLLDQLAHGK